jgi:glycosyltransferase involved in cell wall biosynthesis
MKIAFISLMDGFPWGGSEELWYRTALAALSQGHQLQVCVKYWENNAKIESLQKQGVNIAYRTQGIKSFSSRVFDKLRVKRGEQSPTYFDQIKSFSPDVLLISMGDTFSFFYDPLYYFLQEIKKPYNLISQFNVETGGLQSPVIIERISKTYPWSSFYFVSQRNLTTAQRQCANELQNAKVINNPVNISERKIAPWPSGAVLKMACVARLECSYKGQDILLEALSDHQFNDVSFELDFYGSGPDEGHLKKLISFYGLGAKVFLRGHSSNIDELWAEHHILVLPSISEGTPLSLQEAMLKGRPALTTDVGGCAQLVLDGHTGYLSPVSSTASLKKSLAQLFSTPLHHLEQMGQNAFKHADALIEANPSGIVLADLTQTVVTI